MIGFEEKALCRKIGNVFLRASQMGYLPDAFVESWLCSEEALKIYVKDFNDIAQSPVYILNSLLMEDKAIIFDADKADLYDDLMYWLGYIVTYMQFSLEIPPEDLWCRYDIVSFAGSYEVLHTLSNKNATEECVIEYAKLT